MSGVHFLPTAQDERGFNKLIRKGGEAISLDELYRRYQREAMQHIQQKFSLEQSVAEDILQELFLGLAKRLRDEPIFIEKSSYRRYLFGAARNAASDYYRRRPNRSDELELPTPGEPPPKTPEEQAEQRWLRSVFSRELSSLSANERVALESIIDNVSDAALGREHGLTGQYVGRLRRNLIPRLRKRFVRAARRPGARMVASILIALLVVAAVALRFLGGGPALQEWAGTVGEADGWKVIKPAENVRVVLDGQIYRSRSPSLRVEAAGGELAGQHVVLQTTALPGLEPGSYVISLWLRADQATAVHTRLIEGDRVVGSATRHSVGSAWSKVQQPFRVTTQTGKGPRRFELEFTGLPLWIDEVGLVLRRSSLSEQRSAQSEDPTLASTVATSDQSAIAPKNLSERLGLPTVEILEPVYLTADWSGIGEFVVRARVDQSGSPSALPDGFRLGMRSAGAPSNAPLMMPGFLRGRGSVGNYYFRAKVSLPTGTYDVPQTYALLLLDESNGVEYTVKQFSPQPLPTVRIRGVSSSVGAETSSLKLSVVVDGEPGLGANMRLNIESYDRQVELFHGDLLRSGEQPGTYLLGSPANMFFPAPGFRVLVLEGGDPFVPGAVFARSEVAVEATLRSEFSQLLDCQGECGPPGPVECAGASTHYCLPHIVGEECRTSLERFACYPPRRCDEFGLEPEWCLTISAGGGFESAIEVPPQAHLQDCLHECTRPGATYCGDASLDGRTYSDRWECVAFVENGVCRAVAVPRPCPSGTACSSSEGVLGGATCR